MLIEPRYLPTFDEQVKAKKAEITVREAVDLACFGCVRNIFSNLASYMTDTAQGGVLMAFGLSHILTFDTVLSPSPLFWCLIVNLSYVSIAS
jgi:hypothetical protein